MSITPNTNDPPLWSALRTASARADILRSYSGQLWNPPPQREDMPTSFTNTTGVLSPNLGRLGDGGYGFKQWQQRMRSYRRGQNGRQHSHARSNSKRNNGPRSDRNSNNRRNTARVAHVTLTLPALSGATTPPKTRSDNLCNWFVTAASFTPRTSRPPPPLRPPPPSPTRRPPTRAMASHASLFRAHATVGPLVCVYFVEKGFNVCAQSSYFAS